MSNGRTLFTALARGEPPPRPPFLPLVEALAARVAGHAPAALEADPDLRARAVRQATALVGGDALCLGFDPAIAADEERFARLAEALVRAFEPTRGALGCVAALAGPATLARLVTGDSGKEGLEAVRPVLTRMTEAVCQTRPDLIVFLEDAPARGVPVDGALRRAYAAARKVAAYYDATTAVLSDGWPADSAADEVRRLAPLGLDYAWLGRAEDGGDPDPAAVAAALGEDTWRGAVLPLPLGEPARAAALADAVRRVETGTAVLALGSAGPLAADADLERIMETKTALGALHR